MSHIIKPVVSPKGRVIILTGATLWLIAAMLLSATPDPISATPETATSFVANTVDRIEGAPGLLVYPRAFTDAKGVVYVVNEGTHNVIRLAADGNFRADVVYGRRGAGPGELERPRSVAVDSNGNVFVTDVQLRRITKYTADGTFLKSVAVPTVVSVVVDSSDQLIVRPGRGNALLQRYSNDLVEGEPLLEKTDALQHSSPLGVLMAMDRKDQLHLFDQATQTLSVYDRDMNLVKEWDVDPPHLRATIAMRLAAAKARAEDGIARVNGVQTMALDPNGERILFAYLVKPSANEKYTWVASFTVDGELEWAEKRNELVYANAVLADGSILEGNPETFQVLSRGEQPKRTTSGN